VGTNYYYIPKPACSCCGREFDRIHIGKSSAGWCFGLHVNQEDINTLEDWKKLFEIEGSVIMNECGDVVTKEEMLSNITDRSWKGQTDWTDEMYAQNHAIKGPNGLARHSLYPGLCIGHGEGTWDYLIGDFS